MRVLLLVQREPGTEDVCWVVDAADEYTLDEWNGGLPPEMQARIDADPANVRELLIDIPDDALHRPFCRPVVAGQVAEVER